MTFQLRTTIGRGTPNGMPDRRRELRWRRSAFTLIEVLATLVLLGIILPVAMRGISMALAASSHARHTAEATVLAQAKLNDLLIEGTWTQSNVSGDFAPDHPEYHWVCQSEQRDYSLDQVTVTVTWNERGQERSLNLSTLASENDTGATQ